MNTTTDKIDLEIEKMFADTTPLTEADLNSFGEKNREIMERPSFKAGVLKDQFKHAILEALDFDGINQSELAKRCGKSRQALSKQLDTEKPGNFTIDTMVELMHNLDRRVELHYPHNSEDTMVIHCLKEKPVPSPWEQTEKKVIPFPSRFNEANKTKTVNVNDYELVTA
jgi:predicted XRE-type DNA-binding protein